MQGLAVEVQQFGPLAGGSVQLRPFTVFVGPNNTGKSYLAQLVYAISRTSSGLNDNYRFRFSTGRPGKRGASTDYDGRPLSPEADEWLTGLRDRLLEASPHIRPTDLPSSRAGFEVAYDALPPQIRERVDAHLSEYLDSFSLNLGKELERCYDAKISNLAYDAKSRPGESFLIDIDNPEPLLALSFRSQGNRLEKVRAALPARLGSIRFPRNLAYRVVAPTTNERLSRWQLLEAILHGSERIIAGAFPRRSFYLPAARSGILQGQKAIARVGIRRLARAGIEAISIPELPGTVVDFLDDIYSIDRDQPAPLRHIAKRLELDLTPGRVEFVEGKRELPEIYFRQPHVGRLALHRTSSMVSELAPMILLLRYLVEKGDMMIVEEPESHMHPAAQRVIAKALATMANNGAHVLITTHSDYLLQQISNLVALSTKSTDQRDKLGYSPDELLSPENVSAYLFARPESPESGSTVTPLRIDENGIDDRSFGSIAESLYEEALEIRGK
jgi:hypothetical protein